MQKLTPGPGLCDWGTLDLPRKGFLERDCFCSDSELSPPSSSSFFFPPIENLPLQHQPPASFAYMHLVIFLRVVLNMLPVLPAPFSPGGELPPPILPSAFALTMYELRVFMLGHVHHHVFTLRRQSGHCTSDSSHCSLFPSLMSRYFPRWKKIILPVVKCNSISHLHSLPELLDTKRSILLSSFLRSSCPPTWPPSPVFRSNPCKPTGECP